MTASPEPEGRTLGAAVGHAVVDVPSAAPGLTAGEMLGRLEQGGLAEVRKIVVEEGQRPVGLVPVERLLSAPGERSLGELMDPDPPLVTFDTDEELAAHDMADAGKGCLVVVGPGGGLVGLVFPEQMLGVLLVEHDRDMARIGGYLASSQRARHAAEEPILVRLWHRLPWLMIGLLGAMLSAVVMGAFEARLASKVLIALFVPAVVYMADAVGTQTETLVIRGLAVGVPIRDFVVREILTGAVIGVLVGVAFTFFAGIGWGDWKVGLAVGVALFASASLATGLAMILPAVFQRFGVDPAFGSGPLATVVQDLLSILVYLGVVTVIVF